MGEVARRGLTVVSEHGADHAPKAGELRAALRADDKEKGRDGYDAMSKEDVKDAVEARGLPAQGNVEEQRAALRAHDATAPAAP